MVMPRFGRGHKCIMTKTSEMMFEIKWESPIELRLAPRQRRYTWDRSNILMIPGVYIFGWMDGEKFKAIYVGKTIKMKQRINTHHEGDALMDRLIVMPNEPRVLFIGYVFPDGGTDKVRRKVLSIIEKALVRYYVAEGHDLHNSYGECIKKHTVKSKNAPRGLNASIFVEAKYDGPDGFI